MEVARSKVENLNIYNASQERGNDAVLAQIQERRGCYRYQSATVSASGVVFAFLILSFVSFWFTSPTNSPFTHRRATMTARAYTRTPTPLVTPVATLSPILSEDDDPYPPSYSCENATLIKTDGKVYTHTVSANDPQSNNGYWFKFEGREDASYRFEIEIVNENVDLTSDIMLDCDKQSQSFFGISSSLEFQSIGDHTYYLHIFQNERNRNLEVSTIDWTSRLSLIEANSSSTFQLAQDSDGDGIPDEIELNGWDYDGDGAVDVDLPAMGADPLHKDIFVEIDYLSDPDDSTVDTYKPKQESIDLIIESFNGAPIFNPNGETGIHLHVDYGVDAPLRWSDEKETWGTLSRANSLPYKEHLLDCFDSNVDWEPFDVIKKESLAPERIPIFHYNIWGHSICPIQKHAKARSRNSVESLSAFESGSSDFIVMLGWWLDQDEVPPVNNMAGIFMHALGHNLGLKHGGTDHRNFKPNYMSVMNYLFTETGLNINGEWGHYDYSRYDNPSLDENMLSESAGLNYDEWDITQTIYYCDGFDQITPVDKIDWNCDGDLDDEPVKSDVNQDGRSEDLHTTQNDWKNLVFTGGSIGNFFIGNSGLFSITLPDTLPDQTGIDDGTLLYPGIVPAIEPSEQK